MATVSKLDLYKLHKDEYAAARTPRLLTVKPAVYLGIAGRGVPGQATFQEQVGALYGMAFTIKMMKKFAGQNYAVCKLEGLWWGDAPPSERRPQQPWNWKLLIRVPDFLKPYDLEEAREALVKKGKSKAVREVALETLREGLCVQMLHVGPYAHESETIARMEALAKEHGYAFAGLHHEIYLSDPRRVAASRLRTILRQPVRAR